MDRIPRERRTRRRLFSILAILGLVVGFMSAASSTQAKVPGKNGRIVFTRQDKKGNTQLYTVNPDGSNGRLLFSGESNWSRWSPDGGQVDVRHTDAFAATIVNADTGTSRDLPIVDPAFTCAPPTTHNQCAHTDFSCPSWSPDSTLLVCSASSGVDPSRNGLYTIRASDGGGLVLIKSCPPACGFPGNYSPDGKSLALLGPDPSDPTGLLYRIFVLDLNGGRVRAVTPSGMSVNSDDPPHWSPAGDKVLFAARRSLGHRFAIWVVKSDGTGLHKIQIPSCGGAFSERTSIACADPSWSPDGTKIDFTRVVIRAGVIEAQDIYTVNADGSGLLQVTHKGFLNFFPDWGTQPLAP